MPLNTPIVPPELLEKISGDKCVAFIGAGLSMGAGLPAWGRLMNDMVEWAVKRAIPLGNIDELNSLIVEHDFLDAADIIVSQMGENRFREFIVEMFHKPDLKPTATHKLLPQIPFSSVLTSNYDKLIENAYLLAREGASTPVFTHLDQPEIGGALQSGTFHILKTHGDVDRINSIILRKRDYRQLMYSNNAYQIYLQQVFATKTVLFVGFSLTDPDLLTILDSLQESLQGNTAQHFALMDGGMVSQLKAEQFRRNFNINIIRYSPSENSHPEVAEFLKSIIAQTPKKLTRQINQLGRDLENIDSHYNVIASSDGKIEVTEKYPGAWKDKPLSFSFKLDFPPDTPEGQAGLEAVRHHIDTGEQITITSQFIKDVKIPELFTKILNIPTEDPVLVIGPAHSPEVFKSRLILRPDNGQEVTIDSLEFKKVSGGIKKSVISNEHQNHIFQIRFVYDHTYNEPPYTYKADISITVADRKLNLKEELLVERFFDAAARGAMVCFENSETGMPSMPPYFFHDEKSRYKAGWIPILEALLLIQAAMKETLEVPESLSKEEVHQVLNIGYLIKHGQGKGAIKFTLELDVKEIEKLITLNLETDFGYFGDYQFCLQDKHFSLGTVYYVCQVPLSEAEKIRLRREITDKPNLKSHPVYLSTTPENPAQIYCLEYLSAKDFEKLHENPLFRSHALGLLIELSFEAAKTAEGKMT